MSSESEILLFDLASRQDNQCWSPNPWKTRLLLNYKGLDYKTQFLNYPELKTTLEPHLGSPNPSTETYTSPTIRLPDGTYVMDSKNIAIEVEKRYPDRPVHLDSPYLPKIEDLVPKVMKAMGPEFLPKTLNRILNEESWEYWHQTRPPRFGGKPLNEVERDLGGEQAYNNARPFVMQLGDLLKENAEGPFFEGDKVTYPDFQWGAVLRFAQRLGDECYEQLVGKDRAVHDALLNALRPWMERDNY